MQKTNRNMAMRPVLTILFLAAELILYGLILTTGGDTLVWSSYSAIVLCFLYALSGVNRENGLLVGGLFFTVLADFCLVVCSPIEQLWGMVFFLGTQTLYALHLHRRRLIKATLIVRLVLTVVAEVICLIVLQDRTDPLAMVSLCYYANLIMNIVDAVVCRRQNKLLPIALVLFILCDTVIGLQVASAGYLPIGEDTLLHRILFMDFNLSWLFYLPSQVLIALSAGKAGLHNASICTKA